jgi:hypothetical protein
MRTRRRRTTTSALVIATWISRSRGSVEIIYALSVAAGRLTGGSAPRVTEMRWGPYVGFIDARGTVKVDRRL